MQKTVIQQTQRWLKHTVIGHQLCPFAGQPFAANTVQYKLESTQSTEAALHSLAKACKQLDQQSSIETTLLIYSNAFGNFDAFLDYIAISEALLSELHYDGIYQLAHFHPHYQFEGLSADDTANFTNRSPYPTLHLLRESRVSKAVNSYANIEKIPNDNIRKLRDIGTSALQQQLNALTILPQQDHD